MNTACGHKIKDGDVLIAHTSSDRSGEPGTVALCRVLGVTRVEAQVLRSLNGKPAVLEDAQPVKFPGPELASVYVQGHGVTVLESARLTATYAGRPPRPEKVAEFQEEFGRRLMREGVQPQMGGAA